MDRGMAAWMEFRNSVAGASGGHPRKMATGGGTEDMTVRHEWKQPGGVVEVLANMILGCQDERPATRKPPLIVSQLSGMREILTSEKTCHDAQ